jgi:hypothetical protein
MQDSGDCKSDGSDRMSNKGVYTCDFGLTGLPADQLIPNVEIERAYPVLSVSLMTSMTDG